MKQFFKTFFICIFPLLIIEEISAHLAPEDLPYGIFLFLRLFMTLIGSIIAIARLKRKYQLVSFGNSFLAGSTVILTTFAITFSIFQFSFSSLYRYGMAEIILTLFGFMLLQIFVLITVLLTAGKWYAIQKAGKPGYSMLIPIYNIIVLLEIAKKPIWWIALLFIPIANIVFAIMILNGISKQFGKSEGFTVGLVFLGGIFWAILGYGDSQYGNSTLNQERRAELIDA